MVSAQELCTNQKIATHRNSIGGFCRKVVEMVSDLPIRSKSGNRKSSESNMAVSSNQGWSLSLTQLS